MALKPILFFPCKSAWPRDNGTLDLIAACPVGLPVRGPFPTRAEINLVVAVLLEEEADGDLCGPDGKAPMLIRLRGPKGDSDITTAALTVRPELGRGSFIGVCNFAVYSHGRHLLMLLDPETQRSLITYPLSLDPE